MARCLPANVNINIADPKDLNKRHKLIDIITIVICAVVGGANSWEHSVKESITPNG
jgi:hypothetical protein